MLLMMEWKSKMKGVVDGRNLELDECYLGIVFGVTRALSAEQATTLTLTFTLRPEFAAHASQPVTTRC